MYACVGVGGWKQEPSLFCLFKIDIVDWYSGQTSLVPLVFFILHFSITLFLFAAFVLLYLSSTYPGLPCYSILESTVYIRTKVAGSLNDNLKVEIQSNGIRNVLSCTNLLFLPSFFSQSDEGNTYFCTLPSSISHFFFLMTPCAHIRSLRSIEPTLGTSILSIFATAKGKPTKAKEGEGWCRCERRKRKKRRTGDKENRVFVHGNRLAEIRSVCCSWLAGFHMLDTLFSLLSLFPWPIPFPLLPSLPRLLLLPFVLGPIIKQETPRYPFTHTLVMQPLYEPALVMHCLLVVHFVCWIRTLLLNRWIDESDLFLYLLQLMHWPRKQQEPIADHHDQRSDYSLANKLRCIHSEMRTQG